MMKLSNGVLLTEVTGSELEHYKSKFTGIKTGLVRAGDTGAILPTAFKQHAESYVNFELKEEDVMLLTYPKTGTTWIQEILWHMCHNPNLDSPTAGRFLYSRSPFLEFDAISSEVAPIIGYHPDVLSTLKFLSSSANFSDAVYLQLAQNLPNRRIIKSHLPLFLLPSNLLDKCKAVYMVRNPKDVAVSYLHHCRIVKLLDYKGTEDQYVDFYCQGSLLYGSYADHLAAVWKNHDHPNLLILYYEDLKADIIKQMKIINDFIGTNLSEQQLKNIAEITSFEVMKSRESERSPGEDPSRGSKDQKQLFKGGRANFYRKGEKDSWKTDLSEANIEKINTWMSDTLFAKVPALKNRYNY